MAAETNKNQMATRKSQAWSWWLTCLSWPLNIIYVCLSLPLICYKNAIVDIMLPSSHITAMSARNGQLLFGALHTSGVWMFKSSALNSSVSAEVILHSGW